MKTPIALLSVAALLLGINACSDDTDNGDGTDDAGASSSSSSGEATSSSSSGGDPGDAATSSSSSSSSGGGSSGATNDFACQDVAPTGAAITPTPSNAAAPAPTGGTIAAGTYQLTSVVVYGGDARVGAASLKLTLKVSDTQFLRSFSVAIGPQGGVGADSGTYTTSGTSIVADETCEDGQEDNGLGGFVGPYTATDTTLKIFQPAPAAFGGDDVTIEFTVTKQ